MEFMQEKTFTEQVRLPYSPFYIPIMRNLSFFCEKFPQKLKYAKVLKLCGSKLKVNNYRPFFPVSLLSSCRKINEKIMRNRL